MKYYSLNITLIKIILVASCLCLNSCEDKIDSENIKSKCQIAKNKIEECLEIPLGSLNYVDSCGEEESNQIINFKTCDEILSYIGIKK